MAQAERVMIDEARMITGLPERTLQSLSARGQIWGAAKLGKRWTYDRLRLRAWVKAQESATTSRTASINGGSTGMLASLSAGANIENRLRQAIAAKLKGG
jgi:hypothetical protein